MAVITKIDNTPIKQLTFDQLLDALTHHAFFLFMDRGRSGLREGIGDAVDTYVTWMDSRLGQLDSGAYRTMKARDDLAPKVILSWYTNMERLCMDGFITKGSAGLKDGLRSGYIFILDTRI